MRIVLDTNVAFSALLWRGTPYRLLTLIGQEPRIQLYSSVALFEELAGVLARPSANARLSLIGRTARDVLADYVAAVELVEPASVPRVAADDIDDDQVVAAGVTARADLIVSGDRDLLKLGTHAGIPIVTPADALARIIG